MATTDARTRMIQSTAVLIRERGVEGTSFADVIEHSGAPRGSIYHHFPGGKAQLVEEATAFAGEVIAGGLARALETKEPTVAIRRFVQTWQRALEESDCGAGCPVVAATLEGERTPGVRRAAGAAFERWEEALAGALAGQGLSAERARSLGALIVASIEGGVILARAQRSTEPLERVGRELELLIGSALEPR
jgi:AcrR family transcriptional regulator